MIGEFGNAWELLTQFGTLPFNQLLYTDGRTLRFQLLPLKCSAVLPVRSSDGDDVPQGDGKISHRRWRTGYQAHLAIGLLADLDADSGDMAPACDADLVEMLDLLGMHVNELIRTGQVGGAGARLIFTPTGQPARMFDRLQLVSVAPPAYDEEVGVTVVEIDVDSAFPYYIEEAETDTNITDGSTVTINNPGNTDYFPVFEMYGAFTGFTLTNHSVVDLDGNEVSLVYDDSLPGANTVVDGDWIEIEFFRETAYRNGNLTNMKGGIDFRVSDFFPLVPGDNEVEVVFTGGGGYTLAVCKSNGAWA